MNEIKTLMGFTPQQVVEKMKEHLPADAYSEVGGASYLTDINPAYMREVVTEVFGLCGYGWWYEYDPEHMVISSDDKVSNAGNEYTEWQVTLKRFALFYRYDEVGEIKVSQPIYSGGGSDNRGLEDAVKGAITNALNKAFSMLCWQLDVYKGLLDHRGARKGGNGAKAKQSSPPATTSKSSKPAQTPSPPQVKADRDPLPPEKVREVIAQKVVKDKGYQASDEFLSFVQWQLRALFDGDPDSDIKYHTVLAYLFNRGILDDEPAREVTSSKDLTGAEIKALRDWLDAREITTPDGKKLIPAPVAKIEAASMVNARMVELGQTTFV